MENSGPSFITPYLPAEARSDIREWELAGKIAVHRVAESNPRALCQNCMDHGVIYVSYLGAGPTRQPITIKKPSTYIEPGELLKPGWYIITRTVTYICPHCKGVPLRYQGGTEALAAVQPDPERAESGLRAVQGNLRV